jgi:cytochrome c2
MPAKYHHIIKPAYSLFPVVVILLCSLGYASIFAQEDYSPVSPWKGREIFEAKGCVQCHSISGNGGNEGPDLGENKFYGTYLELATLMWNHFPEMSQKMKKKGTQFSEFNTEEMAQLIAYLSYQRYKGESGNEFSGRKLLRSKQCFSCHRFGGEGEDIGPDISEKEEYLSPINLVECMWNHGPQMMELFQEHDVNRPRFKDNEIIDIAFAINSYIPPTNKVPVHSYDLGDPLKGKELVEKKGCLHCHSIRGVGGVEGPDFAEIDLNCSVTQIAGKMWNHGPEMWTIMKEKEISIPVFEKGEMANLIAYLYGINFEDIPGDARAGYEIVNQKKCLSCHSLKDEGTGSSVDFTELKALDSPLSMITTMWNHAPEMHEEQLEKKLKWPKFKGKEMANLYAYLRSLSSSTNEE